LRILITGGAGNVGGSLARKLALNGNNYVVIVDNLSTGSLDKLPSKDYKNWKFYNSDVNNFSELERIFSKHKFEFIFHYAAVVGVKRTLQNPLEVLKDIEGIKNILNLATEYSVNRVFFSSSSEVYGEPVEIPQVESTTPLNAKLPYAIVKNVGEAFFKSFYEEFDLNYTIFRFFNTYGPLQSSDFVVSKFLISAIKNDDITIFGDGLQTRTFCYIDDNLKACIKSLEENLWINEVVNIGNDKETSVIDLANLVINTANSKSKIIHLPPLKEGDMSRRKPDITKMRKIMGSELISLDDGVRRTYDFLLSKK